MENVFQYCKRENTVFWFYEEKLIILTIYIIEILVNREMFIKFFDKCVVQL